MNGIEKITARIQADAKAEAGQILQEGEQRAAAVKAGYQDQAEKESKALRQEGEAAAQRQFERLESAAGMEARQQLLGAKQACLEEAFAKAQEKLLALPDGEYAALLARMAVKAARTGREEIILNARDRKRVGTQVASQANALLAQASAPAAAKEMKGSKAGDLLSKVVTGANALIQGTALLTLSEETREMAGGLILRDGSVEINCAFETQLRVLRESMAADVAAILFA